MQLGQQPRRRFVGAGRHATRLLHHRADNPRRIRPRYIHGVDAVEVWNTGATQIRHVVPPELLGQVLLAFNEVLLKAVEKMVLGSLEVPGRALIVSGAATPVPGSLGL